jgi:hypothetical protein
MTELGLAVARHLNSVHRDSEDSIGRPRGANSARFSIDCHLTLGANSRVLAGIFSKKDPL